MPNKVHIQEMEVLPADKVHKQEPQCKWLCISHNHPYISSSKTMWYDAHLPCHLCRDGCMKHIAIPTFFDFCKKKFFYKFLLMLFFSEILLCNAAHALDAFF